MTKPICLLISALLIISCSESSIESQQVVKDATTITTKSEDSDDPTSSGTIPVGEVYVNIYESYTLQGFGTGNLNTVIGNVESIAMANPAFVQLLSTSSYTPVSTSVLTGILNQANNNSLAASLQITSLSTAGRQKMVQLYEGLTVLKTNNSEYDAVNSYLLAYDQTITGGAGLSASDITIILTTSTILNNGFYAESKKRRRDRDWELSVGHIAATAYGAHLSMADAITYSLAGKYSLL